MPPIDITKNEKILIDGYHRIIAHRLEKIDSIDVNLVDISKEDVLWEATKRNSRHGHQLIPSEKRNLAQIFYNDGHNNLDEIGKTLAVSISSVEKWTKELREQESDERNQHIFELYLECKTQEEIATEIELSKSTVNDIIKKFEKQIFTETEQTPPESLQIENHWDFPRCDNQYGTKDYPGRMVGQIVENILWYYTEPFDVVLDPMAGGGTTIDVCKTMYRRYLAYDIKPLNPPYSIQQNNILEGIPTKKKGIVML